MRFVKSVLVFLFSFIIIMAVLTLLVGSIGANVGIVEYGLFVLVAAVIATIVTRKVSKKLG